MSKVTQDESTDPPNKKLLPAVTLVFKTKRAQAAFLSYLQLVQTGRQNNPSIALMLGQLACDPVELELYE